MSNDWDFYMLRVDDKPASIMVDLGIAKSAPIKTHPVMGYLRTYLKHSHPKHRLSTDEEFQKLCDIGDTVDAVVEDSNGQHIYVGRNTNDGTRDFFFYTDSLTQLEAALSVVIQKFSDYEFETGGRDDENWGVYQDFLHPKPLDYQRIQSRRVCETLQNEGDDLTQSREIDHRVYFKKKADLKTYSKFVSELNFKITGTGRRKPLVGEHYVDFKRSDIPSQIDDVVDELYLKSVELNGDYDGWGCTVVKTL